MSRNPLGYNFGPQSFIAGIKAARAYTYRKPTWWHCRCSHCEDKREMAEDQYRNDR